MYNDEYFVKFCKSRNIKASTCKGYESALKLYVEFHGLSLKSLIKEAVDDESNPLKDRKIKKRLLDFRMYLISTNLSSNTVKTYFSKIKTFYQSFDVEIPRLPDFKYDQSYVTSYFDLPTKEHIRQVLDISSIDFMAVVLFMSSSGTARAETLSLTVGDFIDACREYHDGGSMDGILNRLEKTEDIVPTFYLKRIKTDKYYYTFCSPEASDCIVRYLKTRQNLKLGDKLFDFRSSTLLIKFQEVNDSLGWGFKGSYRFFRSHVLRKFHASNIGLPSDYIDSLQGRSKNEVHETYIKPNPSRLKEIYKSAMRNVMIYESPEDETVNQEFNITINVFLSGKEYNII